MDFGIFSNGFRPHTSAGRTYDEDIYEIVLAEQLGFRDAYISEGQKGSDPFSGFSRPAARCSAFPSSSCIADPFSNEENRSHLAMFARRT